MAYTKKPYTRKTWENVPDPSKYDGDLNSLPRFDADNMNRIENGIENALHLTADDVGAVALHENIVIGTDYASNTASGGIKVGIMYTDKRVPYSGMGTQRGTNNLILTSACDYTNLEKEAELGQRGYYFPVEVNEDNINYPVALKISSLDGKAYLDVSANKKKHYAKDEIIPMSEYEIIHEGNASTLVPKAIEKLPTSKGGTGKSSVTKGNLLVGNGTDALTEKTPFEVSDMEWTTLGSVAISYDSGDVYPNIESTKGNYKVTYDQTYSIPFDSTLLDKCSQIRYIIKNYNVSQKCRETLERNDDVQAGLDFICELRFGSSIISANRNIYMKPSDSFDYTISRQEDTLVRQPFASQPDKYDVSTSSNTLILSQKSIPDTVGNVRLYIVTDSHKNGYAISMMQCVGRTTFSCVVELQAKR